jgi:transcriptional regulator with PAS, ATPase and Fis domain
MRRIFGILPSVAESDTTALLTGESGTGKELIARAIHSLSHRKDKPLIAVNCGALPDNLLESELFGYKAGAFTDARRDKPGRFAMAEGGTIFLDEIADISATTQVKLLRVLESHTYEPLGGTDTIKADVRIIAAANVNLKDRVEEGAFREDLYYRVNVLKIELPPLRDRREDIPLLVEHFIRRFNKTKNKQITHVSPEVSAALMTHDYPGNIRELENIIEHAFVLCRGSVITMDCLPQDFIQQDQFNEMASLSVEEFERHLIVQILRKHDWKRAPTAAELGMSKTTLWRKMKKLNISESSR